MLITYGDDALDAWGEIKCITNTNFTGIFLFFSTWLLENRKLHMWQKIAWPGPKCPRHTAVPLLGIHPAGREQGLDQTCARLCSQQQCSQWPKAANASTVHRRMMDKRNVVQSDDGIVFSQKKEGDADTLRHG